MNNQSLRASASEAMAAPWQALVSGQPLRREFYAFYAFYAWWIHFNSAAVRSANLVNGIILVVTVFILFLSMPCGQ
jgi:hypothetical protein